MRQFCYWKTLDWGEKRGESCIGTKKISRENIGDDQTCVFSRVEHTSTTYNDQLLVSHRKKNLTTFYNVLQRFTTFYNILQHSPTYISQPSRKVGKYTDSLNTNSNSLPPSSPLLAK
jgi:hypothetical protein